MNRLLIDTNSIVPYLSYGEQSGIGRTTIELLNALAQEPELPFEVILYSQNLRGIGGRNLHLPFKNWHIYLRHTPYWDNIVKRYGIREWTTRYDLMHIPHNFERVRYPEKCIVTLHDALFMKSENPTEEQRRMQLLVPPFAQRCKHIITCSDSSKRDIMETMNIPSDKISVIYWGIRHDVLRPINNKAEVKNHIEKLFQIDRPYFFSLSCNAKRKRADVLVRSYICYCEKNPCPYDLIMVWDNPPADLITEINNSSVSGRIHFIKSVTDEELTLLYNGATALFFPSQYEGFGLPVIEAMACGTPVVTCRNSSLGEIAGDAAIYLEEPVEESIPQVIDVFVKGIFPLNDFISNGLKRAAEFTWEKCAGQTIDIYKRCLEI